MFARRLAVVAALAGVILVLVGASSGAAVGRARGCGSLAYAGTVVSATASVGCAAARHVIDTWLHERCAAKRAGCTIDRYACRSGRGPRVDANRVTCRRGGRMIIGVSGP